MEPNPYQAPTHSGGDQRDQKFPTSLRIVAFLFLLNGIVSLLEVIVSLMHGDLDVNLGVLGLFIGRGLLRLSRGWRTCALVFLWIAMIGIPIAMVVVMFASGPFDFIIFEQKVGPASKGLVVVLGAIGWILAGWQYRVLTRPDVRKLFGVPGA